MKYRMKPVLIFSGEQWFPGKHIDGVQELCHDPGDGTTVSNGYGMLGEQRVNPGDWIVVETDGAKHSYTPSAFATIFEPIPDDSQTPCVQHKWVGKQLGGHPADAESTEWVEFCNLCGVENQGSGNLQPAASHTSTEGGLTFKRLENGDVEISDGYNKMRIDAGHWASTVLILTKFDERPNDWHRFMEHHQGTRDVLSLAHPWEQKAAIQKAVQEERQRCARVAFDMQMTHTGGTSIGNAIQDSGHLLDAGK